MGVIYVARSAKLSKWAADVGLSKHVFKVGFTDAPVKEVVASGWAGETDWTVVKQQPAEGVNEAEIVERLARKERTVDPKYYPRLKDATGIFKVDPTHVENHMVVTRALAGAEELRGEFKPKPADFAAYLIHNALR
jgi:hypothetical protein